MSFKALGDSLKIRNTRIKNRICLPPMVTFCYEKNLEGFASELNVEHYRAIAKGQTGLIIQEATCVSEGGKLSETQLGIWDDKHIEGLKKITDAVHSEGGVILVQIHHAGIVGIAKEALCPSAYSLRNNGEIVKTGREMSLREIHEVQKDFIQAGRRAYLAGYDGVELHGCHGYLICQFLNSRVNMRQDTYGTDPLRFVTEMMEGIRKETSENFIIGIRLGAFEPTLEDGIRHAAALEQAGIDFLDISYGFRQEMDAYKPEGFAYKDIHYAAGEIKKNVQVPVFAVNEIHTPEQAMDILNLTNVDLIDIGRSLLVDPDWTRKALEGETPGSCRLCKVCAWRTDQTKCAGRILLAKKK